MVKNKNNSDVKINNLSCYNNPKTNRKCKNGEFLPYIEIGSNDYYNNEDIEHLNSNQDNLNNIEYPDDLFKTNKNNVFECYVAEYDPPDIKIIINPDYLKEIAKILKILLFEISF